METINGVPIITSRLLPEFSQKLKLSDSVQVTDEFRLNFNQYLLDTFGEERLFINAMGCFHTHPNNLRYLKLQLSKYEYQRK